MRADGCSGLGCGAGLYTTGPWVQSGRCSSSPRRAITLVELLVVIAIIGILATLALRQMRLGVEERGVREAARSVNVYLGSARNRAMELGRPVGVLIERLPTNPDAAMVLRQVDSPPPYAGDMFDARIVLTPAGGNLWSVSFRPSGAGDSWPRLVNSGDLLRLNYQGPLYVVEMPDANNKLTIRLRNANDLTYGPRLPADVLSAGVPFQVYPRPIPAGVAPLSLSLESVIDLQFSGLADPNNANLFSAQRTGGAAIYIMFSPNGGVDRVSAGAFNGPVTQPIFLLVGRSARIPAGAAEDGLANYQDGNNLWVTINPQTGLIVTGPVVPSDDLFQSRVEGRTR